MVHGVQGLQVRVEYDEREPRDRPLHAGGVGDDASGRLRGEPLHQRRRGSARQGLLHVRLQLCPRVGIIVEPLIEESRRFTATLNSELGCRLVYLTTKYFESIFPENVEVIAT